MTRKKCTFSIDPVTADGLKTIKARLGLSENEQVRRAIELWLDSFKWPAQARRQRSRVKRSDRVGDASAVG